jgi:hypothetical protein
MEWFSVIWSQISVYVDVEYLVVFMLLAYMAKKYFEQALFLLTNMQWKTVYTVLVIATITAIPFLVFGSTRWEQVLFSFTLGTSLHELIFKRIERIFRDEDTN